MHTIDNKCEKFTHNRWNNVFNNVSIHSAKFIARAPAQNACDTRQQVNIIHKYVIIDNTYANDLWQRVLRSKCEIKLNLRRVVIVFSSV